MALLSSTYSALVSALGSSSSADDILQYINYLDLVGQQVDPGATSNVGIPGSTGYILGMPGGSLSVEEILVDAKPTASASNKQLYSSTIGLDYNSNGFNLTGNSGMTNLSLPLTFEGSGTIPTLSNLSTNAQNNGTGLVGLMESASISATLSNGSNTTQLNSFHTAVTTNSSATVGTVNAFVSDGNLSGSISNYTGLLVQPSGNASITNPTGVNINMSGLSGIPTGSANALNISSGYINTHGDFVTSSNLGRAPYNQFGNGIHATANLTGTTMITNNLGGSMTFDSGVSMVSGSSPIPISVLAMTGGTRVKMAAGSSIDSFVSSAAGIEIDSASGGGAITNLQCYMAAIGRDLGTNIAITNAYGFRVLNTTNWKLSGTGVTNAWGISIEDPGCKNYFAGEVDLGSDLMFTGSNQKIGGFSSNQPELIFLKNTGAIQIGSSSQTTWGQDVNSVTGGINSAFYFNANGLYDTGSTNDYSLLNLNVASTTDAHGRSLSGINVFLGAGWPSVTAQGIVSNVQMHSATDSLSFDNQRGVASHYGSAVGSGGTFNAGYMGFAMNATVNAGAMLAAGNDTSDAKHNYGLASFAYTNTGSMTAGYFKLLDYLGNGNNSYFFPASSQINSAIIVDNGAVSADVANFMVAGVPKVRVDSSGTLVLAVIAASSVPTPPSGQMALFFDSSNSNLLSSKDSSGTVTPI